MSDEVQEPKIETSAPPKSIEIQSAPVAEEPAVTPVVQNQGAMLTGGIGQTQGNLMATMPQNVKFVMGPNGQMIAIEKPPFVWKHFFIGGGIPFALFFVPLLILMIGDVLDYDVYEYEDNLVTMTKDENSTIYRGQLTVEEDYYLLESCNFYSSQESMSDIYCDRYDDYKANIYIAQLDTDEPKIFNGSNAADFSYAQQIEGAFPTNIGEVNLGFDQNNACLLYTSDAADE